LELDLLDRVKPETTGANAADKTLSHYLTKIARLGGYLGRSNDPPPGNIVMWRGLARLTDITLGSSLRAENVIESLAGRSRLTRRDLLRYIPSKSKVSEVLGRRRPRSLPMIRALRSGLKIPADILAQEPRLVRNGKLKSANRIHAGRMRGKSLRRSAAHSRWSDLIQ